ncbi:MAG: 1-deoxy-D-xylulose-5-phosphate reductoisomerase [Bacillota bacterium]|jgi:1-deoxy-D-xylulose-5-phosphate reductoisomerase
MTKNIALLGSTGSIGRQTLDVIDWFDSDFTVGALAAHSNIELLQKQVEKYHPPMVAIADESRYALLKEALSGYQGEIVVGQEGLVAAATLPQVDTVVAAISGVAGLAPVIAAIKTGKNIALANKEVLVAAGHLVMDLARQKGVSILPVDSEHSAVFQCLKDDKSAIDYLILTASGGPFRDWPAEKLAQVKAEDALKHPTWNMGPKITIDSASLMNKGLEVIEAHWLFAMPYDKIQVVIHKESVIHSLVQYQDGSLLAHLGPPDMRIPIQYALTYPQRRANSLQNVDLAQIGSLTFERPDLQKFPCLALAYQAGNAGGTYPAAMNAANEELVRAYLRDQISFAQIGKNIEIVLERHQPSYKADLADILEADATARDLIRKIIGG